MRFRCKRCNKFVSFDTDTKSDITCPNCGTEHTWRYDNNGWGYYGKEFTKQICPLCKQEMFVPIHILNSKGDFNQLYFRYKCELCGQELIGMSCRDTLYFFGYYDNYVSCEWCGNELSINTEEANQERIEKQDNCFPYKEEICRCNICGNKTKIVYRPWFLSQPKSCFLVKQKVNKSGRKRKIKVEKIEEFIKNNSLYQTYGLLHPFHIEDFIDDEHYDYDKVFDYLEEQGYEIFESYSLEEKRELDVALYKSEFDKLVLKEEVKIENVTSLSNLLNQTAVWKSIRKYLIEKHDFICPICGFRTDNTKLLHVHENWEVNGSVAILKSVELICSRCHACKHRNQYVAYRVMDGQSELDDGIPRADMLTIHLMKVNNVSKEVIYAYRKKLFEKNREIKYKNITERNKVEELEYKYRIADGIPCKEQLEDTLRTKGLLDE